MLDVETTLSLTRILDHIIDAEARGTHDQGIMKAREALSALLAMTGAPKSAIALHEAEVNLAVQMKTAVGRDEAHYRKLHQAITAVDRARFTHTLCRAFGVGGDALFVLIEEETGFLFSADAAAVFADKAKAILERYHD